METRSPLPVATLRPFSASLHGSLITARDPLYDEARTVWNAMIDRRPQLIVRAKDTADIQLSLAFAAKHSLPLAIRGGGHNVAGFGTVEAGLVLDMRALNRVEVEVEQRMVHVGAGTLLGELDAATSPHSLAVPVGVISQTGVAGLCLGGGFGWLTRAHGLSVDNLLAADLVTPAGEELHVDGRSNPELLWGLRGGGGNFGVVTRFTFRAHRLPQRPFGGNLIYRAEHWKGALRALRDWANALPDPMTVIATALVPPTEWGLGEKCILVLGFLWADADRAKGEACVEEFISAAPPDELDIEPVRWTQWQSAMDGMFPKGVRAYWKNTAFDTLSEEAIEVLVAHATTLDWPGTAFDIHVMGGAMGRVPPQATAFPDRAAPYWINIYGFWNAARHDTHHISFIRDFHRRMQGFSHGGEYVNFSSADEQHHEGFNALDVYGPEKLARLAALKHQYDPHNMLRLNHNIVPAPAPWPPAD